MRGLVLVLVVPMVLLAACQTVPSAGTQVQAVVTQVPRDRGALRDHYRDLHAALLAGVARVEFVAGRLVRGECLESEVTPGGGTRPRVSTALLPPGVKVQLRTFMDAEEVRADGASLHLRYLAAGAELEPSVTGPSAFVGGRDYPLCRQPGSPSGRSRLLVTGVYQGWEYDFAKAELARHEQFSDAELSAGRVVQVSCQLKVLDGSDWHAPVWWARVPASLNLEVGDRVQLQAGAESGSKDAAPLATVLARTAPSPGKDPAPKVLCYPR